MTAMTTKSSNGSSKKTGSPAKSGYMPSVAQSVVWATPRDLWVKLNEEFGFSLDVCALQENTTVPNSWYGPDHKSTTRRDGLAQDWAADAGSGIVWMNPPYGRELGPWMAKAHAESVKGATVVCLIPSRTDVRWWHEYVVGAEVRFIKGRLKFGGSKTPAPFPSAVVVLRPESVALESLAA